MNIKESIQQINELIEAWELNEACLNQTDIDAMKCLLKENQELKRKLNEAIHKATEFESEVYELKKQLEYLRSGEYLNQLRFERNMLQDLVDKKEISKEDKEFIDMTRRNTELLEQQKEFIKWLEEEKNRLARELSNLYEDSLGHTRLVNEDIFDEVNDILQKYKSIIGGKDEFENKYAYVIIRNEQPLGLSGNAFDYLLESEKEIEKLKKEIEKYKGDDK